MRYVLLLLSALLLPVTSARADVSVSIGINVPVYPTLVRVPGYPAYYDPRMDANYFFYDGLYWVFWGDHWYASSWFNGPWQFVDPYYVPVYVLCIPVRYYRHRPHYFRHWHEDRPPHWGEHWGRDWEHRRSGWDRWDRHSAPEPAPLPHYQRSYAGDRYPREVGRQQRIRADNYRFEPRERVSRDHFRNETARVQAGSGPRTPQESRVERGPRPQRESRVPGEPRIERDARPERGRVVERESRPPSSSREQQPPQRIERSRPEAPDRSDRNGGPSRERSRDAAPTRADVYRERPEPRSRPDPEQARQAPPSRDQGDRPRQSGRDRDEHDSGRGRESR